jgi:RNA polymerase sigma-70 factor, ECF subfamily
VATCVVSATPTNLPPASMLSLPDKKQQKSLEASSVRRANVPPPATISLPDKKQQKSSEATLVQRAQRGDEEAFGTLYELHKKRVYSVCLQMTRDVADAEDLTQEAFLQVFRSINSFRGDSAFSTWLYRIAVNTVLMKLRRRKTPPLVSLDEPVSTESASLKREVGSADPRLSGAVDRIALRRAVAELPCRLPADFRPARGRRLSASRDRSTPAMFHRELQVPASQSKAQDAGCVVSEKEKCPANSGRNFRRLAKSLAQSSPRRLWQGISGQGNSVRKKPWCEFLWPTTTRPCGIICAASSNCKKPGEFVARLEPAEKPWKGSRKTNPI